MEQSLLFRVKPLQFPLLSASPSSFFTLALSSHYFFRKVWAPDHAKPTTSTEYSPSLGALSTKQLPHLSFYINSYCQGFVENCYPLDTKICQCSSPLYETAYCLHVTHTYLLGHFKSSVDCL
jgi:hypothetical protein